MLGAAPAGPGGHGLGERLFSSAGVMDVSNVDPLGCWGCSSDLARAKRGHEMRFGLQVPGFISGC